MGDRLGIHDVVDLLLRLTFFLKKPLTLLHLIAHNLTGIRMALRAQTGSFANQLPDGSQKEIVSHSLDAPQTRKSLVKGERFIRSVWRT